MEESKDYRGLEIKIEYQISPDNPFEEWDCNLPLISSNKDYSEGGINSYLSDVLSDGQIIRHQKVLCEALEIEHHLDGEHDKESKIDFIRDEIASTSSYSALEKVCELAKVPCLNTTSRGYSQSDWSDLFICYTEEFENITGCTKDKVDQDMLQATADLFGYWAWGDVYFYSVIDEHGEVIDSCGGFYGNDHDKSSLMEYATDAIDAHLKNKLKEKFKTLKVLIKNSVPLFKRNEILSLI